MDFLYTVDPTCGDSLCSCPVIIRDTSERSLATLHMCTQERGASIYVHTVCTQTGACALQVQHVECLYNKTGSGRLPCVAILMYGQLIGVSVCVCISRQSTDLSIYVWTVNSQFDLCGNIQQV